MVDSLSFTSRPAPLARSRRALVITCVVAPGAAVALDDWTARGDLIARYPWTTLVFYAASLGLGATLWGGLVAAASARHGWMARVLLFGGTLAVGAQLYFFDRYHVYMNPRAVQVGTSMLPSIGQELWSDRASVFRALLPPAFLAFALPLILRRAQLSRRTTACALDLSLGALLVAAFTIKVPGAGEQGASPDVLYLHAVGDLAGEVWWHNWSVATAKPGPRSPIAVPTLAIDGRRSVLLVLTESIRGADACSVPAAECQPMPYTNALLPGRFGFSQMRAVDSTTALSVAVLWSGLSPTAPRQALHSAPLIWEYARAAGFDTAYWTSQNLLFANSGKWLEGIPASYRTSATDLDPDAPYELGADDALPLDVALRDLRSMGTPLLGVVHLSNTHFPYLIDTDDAPFQPQSADIGSGQTSSVHNRYLDAVRRQDRMVARFVRDVRTLPGGDRIFIAFVSDHGEQFRERGAMGHTWGLYDEEVRVPFWIDAPAGTLTSEEEASLRHLRDKPVTELDVLPTLLDAMGLWDAPELASFRQAMPGRSLLRDPTSEEAVVLTNCSGLYGCAFKNWGAARGTRKLLATQNDMRWKCFDVARDPLELTDLGEAACSDLRALAESEGRGSPF